MFNVCLIQPPIEDFYATTIRNIPLGLLSIGASLKVKHNVRILDFRYGKSHSLPIPADLSGVADYYRTTDASPFGLYKRYARYGLSAAEIYERIPENIEIFLISALFTTYVPEVLAIIPLIRQKCQNASIIIGGSGAIFNATDFFQAGASFVIAGEGEIACVRLLDELEKVRPNLSAVPNLIWQDAGTIITNPVQIIENLDDLPFPDYSLPGTPEYMLNGKRHAMLMASRGCPHRCQFCSIHRLFGKKYRARSVENVLAELKEKVQLGFRSFDFEDDHFGGSSRWLNQVLDGIIKNFPGYNLSFQAMNGITASNLNENILLKMKTAGFSGINISLVTPDQPRQNALNRPFDTRQFTNIVTSAHKIGLSVTAYIIIGLPGDTIDENLQAILFLAELPVLIGPSLFYLVPGTPLFDELDRAGNIPASLRCYRSSYFPFERPDFSRTAAMTLFRICRIINFLKAAQEYHYEPSEFKIENDAIILPDKLSGRQSQITLGFALLKLLKQTGKIYGTGKKANNRYPIYEENTDNILIKMSLLEWN